MKKQLAIAVTLALLALPVNSGFAAAETTTAAETTNVSLSTETTTETTTDNAADTTVDTTAGAGADTSATTAADPAATDTTQSDTTTTDTSTDGTVPTDETDADETAPTDGTTPTDGTAPTDDTSTTDPTVPPVVDENGEEVDPGTLPDSPFYWLSSLIEKLQVILTFDAEGKTALMEKLALKKLAAAQEMAKQGKTEKAEKAMTEYMEKVEKAQAFLEEVKDPESDAYKKLESALANTSAKNIETLSGLLDKLPPQAAERVALNIVRSMDKAVDKLDKKEKARVQKEFKKAAKAINQDRLDQETKAALKEFQQSLSLKENPKDAGEGAEVTVTAQIMQQVQSGTDKKTSNRTVNQVKVQQQDANDENAPSQQQDKTQLKVPGQQQINDQTRLNQQPQTQPKAQDSGKSQDGEDRSDDNERGNKKGNSGRD